MGALTKEYIREAMQRARARRRNDLLEATLFSVSPKRRDPIARVRCEQMQKVDLGEKIAVTLDKNIGAARRNDQTLGVIDKIPGAARRRLPEQVCTIVGVVSRKHAVGFGFDVELKIPRESE